MTNHLEILFENENLIAINKPHGLLVHKTKLAKDAEEHALQLLRNQIKQRVYPAHRLDRKTSGVLLFAKNKNTNTTLQGLFRDRQIKKRYKAIVRGYIYEEGIIDYPLFDSKKERDAITRFNRLQLFEINLPSGGFDTSRYSLVNLEPETGRHHQLRKHLAHISHPILGDRPHGCNKQNRLWKEKFNMTSMMLCADRLEFETEDSGYIVIEAKPSPEFERVLKILTHNQNELD